MEFGYVRVSSRDQNEARQMAEMEKLNLGDRQIFIDKESGKDFNRPKYQAMVTMLREGDIVYILSIDRLGRNYNEILEQWNIITKQIKADIVVLDMPLLDTRKDKDVTGVLISDIVLQLLSYVAQKERENIKARQAEGIAIAKMLGKYQGRKPMKIDTEKFIKLYGEVKRKERTATYAMDKMGVKRNTWYTLVKEYESRTGRFYE